MFLCLLTARSLLHNSQTLTLRSLSITAHVGIWVLSQDMWHLLLCLGFVSMSAVAISLLGRESPTLEQRADVT